MPDPVALAIGLGAGVLGLIAWYRSLPAGVGVLALAFLVALAPWGTWILVPVALLAWLTHRDGGSWGALLLVTAAVRPVLALPVVATGAVLLASERPLTARVGAQPLGMLVVGTLLGAYLGVPDTEEVTMAAVGGLLLVTMPLGPAANRLLILLALWAIAAGARGRPASAVMLLGFTPVLAALAAKRPLQGASLWALFIAHTAAMGFLARFAALSTNTGEALLRATPVVGAWILVVAAWTARDRAGQ